MAHVTHEQRAELRRHLRARLEARGIEVPDRIAAQIAELLDEALDEDLLALPQPQRLDYADEDQRIVVTGMGAVTPFGTGLGLLWGGLVEGRSAIHRVDAEYAAPFPTRIGGEALDFDARAFMDAKDARRMSRASQFAVAAARMAIDDSRIAIDDGNRYDVGVLLGCGTTSIADMEQAARALILKGGDRVSPLVMPMALPNMPASQVAIQLGLRGYTSTISTACAASSQAIGEAAAVIRRGDAEIMVAGGTEAPFCQLSLACFNAMRALSTRNDDPERASRPFDIGRDGFVPAEAGAALVLERLSSARRRGAPIYAELLGYATTCDAFHVTAPDPEGQGAARAIARALASARITPQQVDYINAHATSTTVGDIAETKAIKQVFDEYAYSVPVSAPKSMIGHATGAAGAVEAVATILALKHGVIPPTINLDQPDPACDLDYVPHTARPADLRIAISNSFAFGGVNAVLVFSKA
jgi:3-oxoacyl-[acyl-carrier-protein] synthase II